MNKPKPYQNIKSESGRARIQFNPYMPHSNTSFTTKPYDVYFCGTATSAFESLDRAVEYCARQYKEKFTDFNWK